MLRSRAAYVIFSGVCHMEVGMHKVLLFAFAAMILPAISIAGESEQVVTFSSQGQSVVGTLRVPEGDPAAVVLMLHGFVGSRDELTIPSTNEGVFVRAADILAEKGFASLRIDFRGSGESIADMTYEATTFDGQIADALAAIEYLASLDKVDGQDISMIGWSQGGLVAAGVAARSVKLDSVALWQAVGDPLASYGGILGSEKLAEGQAASPDQTITAALPWGGEVSLNGAFFDGVETFDPVAEIAAYPGPLFVTQGMADTTVLPEVATFFMAAHEGPEELWTAEMDHVFNVFSDTETLDEMVAATAAFFKAHDD